VKLTDMRILLHQVLSNDDFNFGYNAATGQYEDMMAAGIIDPTKVCGLVVSLFLLALIGIVDSSPSAELDSLTKGWSRLVELE
jgi:hypothetical protein